MRILEEFGKAVFIVASAGFWATLGFIVLHFIGKAEQKSKKR